MASKIYPDNHQLAVVLARKDLHSDIEDGLQESAQPIRVVPVWRSDSLTTVLHGLDKMVISQATHHKTKLVHQELYGRSKSTFSKKKGINGVLRDLPTDCYSKTWIKGLCKFDRDTLSEADACSIHNLAKGINNMFTLAPITVPIAKQIPRQSSSQTAGGQAGPSTGDSMNEDLD